MAAHTSQCITSVIKLLLWKQFKKISWVTAIMNKKKHFHEDTLWIYMSCFMGFNDKGEKRVDFKTLHCQRRPDFPRAKLLILSHADWFECIWMTVLTSPGTGSCLCDQLASQLHFKESPIFIALTLGSRLYAALTISFQCCNWRTKINKLFLHWHAALFFFFLKNLIHDHHAERQLQQKPCAANVFTIYIFILKHALFFKWPTLRCDSVGNLRAVDHLL